MFINDEVQKELIKNLPAIITAFGVLLTALISAWGLIQSKKNATRIEESAKKHSDEIEVVRLDVNGKMEKLLETTKQAAHAKGIIEGEAKNSSPMQIEILQSPVAVKVVDE